MCEKLEEDPPLAMKCKFFDCIPKNDAWAPEATKEFLAFTEK